MTTDLYLIRHGESVSNVEPIIAGTRGDRGLTARGHEQAELLQERLRTEDLRADALYSSTMPRALQTAEYVARALGLRAIPDDDWHELRPGEADGVSMVEWQERFGGREFARGEHPFRPFAPGGESLATFLLRIGSALTRVVERHPDETVVVVCHGGVLQAAFYHAFGLGPTARRVYFVPQNTSITHWRYQPAEQSQAPRWTLVVFNDAAHLRVAERGEAERQAVPTPASGEE